MRLIKLLRNSLGVTVSGTRETEKREKKSKENKKGAENKRIENGVERNLIQSRCLRLLLRYCRFKELVDV